MTHLNLTLARRLGWKPEGKKRVSPAVGVAVTGVALSIVVMLLSVAVILGFKREVSQRLLGLDDSITLAAYDPGNGMAHFNSAEVTSTITLPDEAEIQGYVSVFGLLKTDNDFMTLKLEGSDSCPMPDSLIRLSQSVVTKLRLKKGDKVPAYFFIDNRLRVRALTIDSIYNSGFSEHDDAVAYVSPTLIRNLLGIPSGHVHELGITNIDTEQITPLADRIHSELLGAYYGGQLNSAYVITTIFQTDASFFSWLALLDTNVVVILMLMGAVAAFTLISSLFIIILERVRTIGLLKALGADNARVRRIFMLMAERLVFRGLLIGNLIGIALTGIQAATHIIKLDQASYYVDFVPVQFSLPAIIVLNIATIALSWVVLMLPAMIIARISPATTMRYE